ncbi:MAG: DUF3108 domain-containing protein [Bdellovibrionales bacterium]
MMKKLALIPAIFVLVTCASKPLEYEHAKDLGKIEAYDKLIQVKDLPTDAPPAVATPVAETPKSPAPAVPKAKFSKKAKKVKKVEIDPSIHLPDLEDGEGFVGRRPTIDPFRVGEKITMMMTYFGVSAGDMILEVKPFKEVNGNKSYHMMVTLKSSDLFSLVYLVDDYGETFIDYENFTPYNANISATESKKLLALKTVFDFKKNKGYRWERLVNKGEAPRERNVEWDILPFSQNVISAFYYVRAFTLRPGKVFRFHVADDGKNMNVKIEVLRKEKIKTRVGEFNTLVLKPTVEIGGIFQPMGDVLFWVTDDERKLYVKLEAQIKIGKVIGVLKSLEKGGP